ncbi:Flp family type IVb pilin [Yoonia maritima]|uniref:Flp family type IVb pilin n=1 Tax=Yoonia maritima TaxID=1435347 RepID=UPI0037357E81
MMQRLANFKNDEDGAVTVDFVVLSAAIVMLGFTAVTTFSPATTGLANDIEGRLDNQDP